MLLNRMIIAINPKTYLSEYGIDINSKTFLKLFITPELTSPLSSLISIETVGATRDRPIASNKPDIIINKTEIIIDNFLLENISLVKGIILLLLFSIFELLNFLS